MLADPRKSGKTHPAALVPCPRAEDGVCVVGGGAGWVCSDMAGLAMSWPLIGLDEKIRLRVRGNEWCHIEVEICRGILCIHGAVGDLVTRREITMGDEIWMANSRWVFINSGCGQIIDDLKRFFPECVKHLPYHQMKVSEIPPSTIKWVNTFFSEKHKAKIQQWRYNGTEVRSC